MLYEATHEVPGHFYRNRLPHFDPKDAPYFVTYRLADSIPKQKANQLLELARSAKTNEDHQHYFAEYERVLDNNGPYHLQDAKIRSIVMESLATLNERDILLYAYTLMPNHVHAVFDLHTSKALHEVMQSHKRFTARYANEQLGVRGVPFWAPETYDRVVRQGRLGSAIWYTLLNPVKAGFVKHWRDWPGTYLAPDCIGFE